MKPGHTVKAVDWSYPTSTNAKKFGFHDQGCYTVSIGARSEPLKAIAGYADRAEAIKHAESLPFNWSTAFLIVNPQFKTP